MPNTRFPIVSILFAVLCCTCNGYAESQPVTFSSLLDELVDIERLCELPDPFFISGQCSSYDRASISPDQATPENWYANVDAGNFIRVEGTPEAPEYVLMDQDGPGAVMRFWSANPKAAETLRIYLDGAETPDFEVNFKELLSGNHPLAPAPIAGRRGLGSNCYLPIPYAQHCKITSSGKDYYYHVGYRTYQPGTPVETLSLARALQSSATISSVARRLKNPEVFKLKPEQIRVQNWSGGLPAGGVLPVTRTEPGAVYRLACRVEAASIEGALRKCILQIHFDGNPIPQVLAPLGDFFGTAPGLNPYQSLPCGVNTDGWMVSHWVMPYQEKMRLLIINTGDTDLEIEGEVVTSSYSWTDRTCHFHCKWNKEPDLATRPIHDVNLLSVTGTGQMVGCVYQVSNPAINWWGEGDEKIYIDGENFPSTFGTGTEDYFGYAWCWNQLFSHAYHNQVRADGPGNFGHTCVSRFHISDPLPFLHSLRFDMELYHHAETRVDLATCLYWYTRPGSQDGFEPLKPEDLTVVRLPRPPRVPNAVEGESMDLVSCSGGFFGDRFNSDQIVEQSTDPAYVVMPCLMIGWHGNQWSGFRSLWWQSAQPGDTAVLRFQYYRPGPMAVRLRALVGPLFGKFQVYINGKAAREPLALYKPGDTGPMTDFDLGTFELLRGENTLTLVCIEPPNPADPSCQNLFGVDFLQVLETDNANQP